MGMVVIGAVFVDIKGYPTSAFIPTGRNAGRVEQIHGGVGRNVAEDIANCELRPTFVSLVDDSGTGVDVVRKLKSHRVNTDYIRKTRNGMEHGWRSSTTTGTWRRPSPSGRTCCPLPTRWSRTATRFSKTRTASSSRSTWTRRSSSAPSGWRRSMESCLCVVANMSIALERRDFLQSTDCFVCNQQEAGILFSDDYSGKTPEEMIPIISAKVQAARIPAMIVTMGADGAVYANLHGESGYCPARKLEVKDTTGAGDAFCAGAAIGLTYGKGLKEACEIGAMLAASVIVTSESVCPRFRPRELGLDMDVED